MTSLSVEAASLAGFRLDLHDLGASFSSNGSRLLSGVTLPAGSAGLLASLAPSIDKFQAALTVAQDTCLTAIDSLGTNLSTAESRYHTTDNTTASALSAVSEGVFGAAGASESSSAGQSVRRFGGMQFANLPEVPEDQYTLGRVVLSAIDLISVYDERLGEAAGVRPVADFLTPLVSDWECLQALGRRIGLIGINDYVASENLASGTRWLLTSWSGDAAQAFEASIGSLGQALNDRSLDLEAVSKIVENGGRYLERLVYNQVAELCSGVLQPMTFLGATFPLGGWAPYVNKPIRDTIRSQISSAVDALLAAARTRHESIQATIDKLSGVLDYAPGRPIPSFAGGEFEVPEKAVIDLGSRRFGYGDNIWWEDSVDSIV